MPWYRQFVYRGINLNGSWYARTIRQKILLEIRQSCENLKGQATISLLHDNPDVPSDHDKKIDNVSMFDIQGVVSERFVSLNLWNTNTKRLGVVTYLLQVVGDGSRLEGKCCWYSLKTSEIDGGDACFHRDELSAEIAYRERLDNYKKDVENKSSEKE